MAELTYEQLMGVLRECAGESDEVAGDGNVAEVSFLDLGYDSLALMETASRLQRDYDIELPDEVVVDVETPQALLDLVNSKLGSPA